MKIRAIEIRNWGCIESLSLAGLHDGVIVLHGPNRTGKSSLLQAIRSGLFDHYHDSQDGTLLTAIPWKTKAAPHVVIEFEHAGKHYRISKTFAKTKDGQTTLEQNSAGGWSVLIKGKEAAKRVRELIGVESSQAGMFQMLWLGQQDFKLPLPREIDPTLKKALESVLGTLITGRDLDFKERLDKACERWFTVKTMRDRKDSPVTKLAADLEQAGAQKIEIDRRWDDAESALKQYDEALARQPELQRNLKEAIEEMELVRKKRESITVRKSQFELAVKNRDGAARQMKEAKQRLQEWDDTQKRLAVAELALAHARLQLQALDEKIQQAQGKASQCKERSKEAERALEKHRQTRSSIDDLQQLLTGSTQCQLLDQTLEQIQEGLKAQHGLEARLADPAILTEDEIKKLRQNRQQATELRAQLEAAEIHVTIRAQAPLDCDVLLDGQPVTGVSLPANGEGRWLIRQQAAITLGQLATVRIGRVQEDRDVEATAQNLADLDRDYRAQLTAANADPNQVAALDDLLKRRLEHEADRKELKRLRDAFARSAPAGLPALQSQRQHLLEQRDAILARRPELCGWVPNQPELEQRKNAFAEVENELLLHVEHANQFSEQAANFALAESATRQEIADQIIKQTVEAQTLEKKIAQNDRPALAGALEETGVRLKEAEATVQEATLSEAEQAIEGEFHVVCNAHANRDQRLKGNETQLAEMRGKLAGTEGLHQQRILADQAVNDLADALKRESRYANAHKLLKELFEQFRQEQGAQTVGPINDRVMGWAKQMGLTEYARLSFEGHLLPGGLVANHALDGDPIELQRESYGTLEQLSLLIRLAVGGLLSHQEPTVAILDDPLAHADLGKHRKMLDILASACRGEPHGPHPTGPLQLIILTCHAERFDYLDGAQQFDLAQLIRRGG